MPNTVRLPEFAYWRNPRKSGMTVAQQPAERPMRAVLIFLLFWAPGFAAAQEFRALARVVPGESLAVDQGREVEITLALTQSVPFRVFTHDAPRRLVVEAREVDWTALSDGFDRSDAILAFATGRARAEPGWDAGDAGACRSV